MMTAMEIQRLQQQIAALQRALKRDRTRIRNLEERVKELEARPPTVYLNSGRNQ
jgi:chromosome segregation ATPase